MVSRRDLLGLAAGVPALHLAMLSGSSAQTGARPKLTFAHPLAGDFLPFFVAKEMGYFDNRGLDVNLIQLAHVGPVIAALVGGSLQLTVSTATALLQAAESGIDAVAVMGITRQRKDLPIASFVRRANLPYQGPASLQGKVIGVPGLNNILDVLVRKWLRSHGVSSANSRFVEAGMAQMRDLLKAEQIDAAPIVDPFRSAVIRDGIAAEDPSFVTEIPDDLVFALVIGTAGWVSQNKDTVARFRQAATDGLAFIRSTPDKAKEIEQKYLKTVSPRLPTFQFDISAADLDAWLRLCRELDLIKGPVDVAKLIG